MKTLKDYRKDILGIRLKGLTQVSSTPEVDSKSVDLAFFADKNDLELQQPMVDKILSLFKKPPKVIFDIPNDEFYAETLFIFGANKAAKEKIDANFSFVFASFGEIAQKPDLKRNLWEKLKKYT